MRKTQQGAGNAPTRLLAFLLASIFAFTLLPQGLFAWAATAQDFWSTSSTITVNDTVKTGEIEVKAGDTVSFLFAATLEIANNPFSGDATRADVTFTVKIPTTIMETLGQDVKWMDVESIRVFVDAQTGSGDPEGRTNGAYTEYTMKFNPALDGVNRVVPGVDTTFSFKASKDFTLTVKEEDSSSTIEFDEKQTSSDPVGYASKSVTGIVRPDGNGGYNVLDKSAGDSTVLQKGDYVVFSINMYQTNKDATSPYVFKPGEIEDLFHDEVYDFVNHDDSLAIIRKVNNGSSVNDDFATHEDWAPHNGVNGCATIKNDNYKDPDFLCYYLTEKVSVEYNAVATRRYIWLQYNPDDSFKLIPGNWWSACGNRLYFDGKTLTAAPGYAVPHYDAGLAIYSTTIHRGVEIKDGAFTATTQKYTGGSKSGYLTNDYNTGKMTIQQGDYVTYHVGVSSQQLRTGSDKVYVYLPAGMEMLDATSLTSMEFYSAYDGGSKAKLNLTTCTDRTQSLTPAPHLTGTKIETVYPVDSNKGYNYTFGDDYLIDSLFGRGYTVYEFDLSNVIYENKANDTNSTVAGNEKFFFTVEITGDAVEEMGKLNYNLLDPNMTAAERTRLLDLYNRYGTLVMAEIGHNYDATKDGWAKLVAANYDVSAADIEVTDMDSNADSDPFNDWFVVNTDAPYNTYTSTLKNTQLYCNSKDGEIESTYENSILNRILSNQAGTTGGYPNADEDDFDMTPLRYVIKQQDELVSKDFYHANINGTWVKDYYKQITDKDSSWLDKPLISTDHVSSTGSVIPYRVRINELGGEVLEGVTFKDTLPPGVSFVCDKTNSNAPFVLIGEMTQADSDRMAGYNKAGQPTLLIDYNNAVGYPKLNNMGSTTFINPSSGHVPTGLIDGTTWDISVTGDSTTGQTLTINFGDIGNAAYEIVYYVYVEKYSPAYTNNATISYAGDKVESDSVSVSNKTLDSGAFSYSKNASALNLETKSIAYELGVSFNTTTNYAAGFLSMEDAIDDLYSGTLPGNVTIQNIVVTRSDDKGATYGTPAANNGLAVTEQTVNDVKKLLITNEGNITGDVRFKINFTVTYGKIPSGEMIVNRFGASQTLTQNPLMKLAVTKVDSADDKVLLSGAKFALLYGDGTAVMDGNNAAITLTTVNGLAATGDFDLDESKANNKVWTLLLRETTPPTGYYPLGGDETTDTPVDITLTVTDTENQNGYVVTAASSALYTLSSDADNTILLTVKNEKIPTPVDPDPVSVDWSLTKVLKLQNTAETEVSTPAGAFSFSLTGTGGDADEITVGNTTTAWSTQTLTNAADGSITLPKLYFHAAGTYTFSISETSATGYVTDNGAITFSVEVTESNDVLTAVLTNTSTGDKASFTNKLKPVTATVEAEKEFYDAEDSLETLTGDEFDFLLELTDKNQLTYIGGLDSNGKATAKNDADGDVTFSTLTFYQAGVYVFSLTEVKGSNSDILYDSTAYTVTITVTAENNGALNTPTVVYSKPLVDGASDPLFINRERQSGSFELEASKQLDGKASNVSFSFTASISEAGAAGLDLTGLTYTTADNNYIFTATGTDSVTFGSFVLTAKEDKTYTFVIAETDASSADGGDRYAYDDSVYTAVVTVTYDEKEADPYDIDVVYYDGQTKIDEIVFENTTYPVIEVEKKDEDGVLMDGVTFTLTDADDNKVADGVTVDGKVRFVLKDYDPADGDDVLTLTETTPEGYYDIDPIAIKLEDGVYNYSIPIVNVAEKSLTIEKLAVTGGATLSGAKFDLYRVTQDEQGAEVLTLVEDDLTTGAEGKVSFVLPADYATTAFLLRETQAPNGYTTNGLGDIRFTVSAAGAITNLTHEGTGDYVAVTGDDDVIITVQNETRPETPSNPDPKPKAAEVTLKAKKTLDEKAPGDARFIFQLLDDSGKLVAEETNDNGGSVTFPALTFDEVGSYVYTLREQAEDGTGYRYDEREYTVTITVKKGTNYTATVVYELDGERYTGIPAFANETLAPEELTDVSVVKVWAVKEGEEHPESVAVQLYNDGEAVGEAVTLNGENNWSYTWEKLDIAGNWTVDEVDVPAGFEKKVTADGTVFTITNTRTDKPTEPENPDKPDVPETPDSPKTYATVMAEKTLNGSAPGSNPFRFVLRNENGAAVQTVTSSAGGSIVFDPIRFDAPGVYTYTVEEAAGNIPVIIYDDAVFAVVITVTRSGSKLQAEVTYPDGNPVFANVTRPTDPNGGDEEFFELDDNGVPLGKWVPDGDNWVFVELEENEVPRGEYENLPKTGNAMLAALAGLGAVLTTVGLLLTRKKKEDEA